MKQVYESKGDHQMKLWHYQPEHFDLAELSRQRMKLDPTQGKYWNQDCGSGFRYREVQPQLCKTLGTDQFLWCKTVPGWERMIDESPVVVEWEIDACSAQILAFYSVQIWEDLVWSRSDDWDALIINDPSSQGNEDIGALLRWPLEPPSVMQRIGPVPARYS